VSIAKSLVSIAKKLVSIAKKLVSIAKSLVARPLYYGISFLIYVSFHNF